MFKHLMYLPMLLVHFFAFGQRDVAEIRAAFIDATSPHILVAAHRAAHQEFPENSLPAIQHAIDMGVDIIEIDVKVTTDGIPVLMHDRTIDRTTTGTGDPETYSLQELQEFRLVAAGDTTELTIPTLEAALNLAKGHIMVDLDLKTDKMETILEVVRKTGTEDIVFFFDSEYPSLHYVQEKDKNLMLMPRAYSYAMADSAIALFHPQVVHIDFSFYTPEVIKLIKDNHARVWINALGEPDAHIRQGMAATAIDTLLMYGANIIQTDEPELLLEALKARELHP